MYIINLYGTNTFVSVDSVSEVAKSTITALSDVETLQILCNGLYYKEVNEGEFYDGLGSKGRSNRVFGTFRITDISFNFNDTDYLTDIQEFWDLLRMRYLYMEVVSYPYTLHTASKVIGIVINPEYDIEESGGMKVYNLECYKRKEIV
jgi:hypothetical protein